MDSIQLEYKINAIFMISKTSDPHRLLLDCTDKISLKRSDEYVVLSNLSIYYIWKNISSNVE